MNKYFDRRRIFWNQLDPTNERVEARQHARVSRKVKSKRNNRKKAKAVYKPPMPRLSISRISEQDQQQWQPKREEKLPMKFPISHAWSRGTPQHRRKTISSGANSFPRTCIRAQPTGLTCPSANALSGSTHSPTPKPVANSGSSCPSSRRIPFNRSATISAPTLLPVWACSSKVTPSFPSAILRPSSKRSGQRAGKRTKSAPSIGFPPSVTLKSSVSSSVRSALASSVTGLDVGGV